MSDLDRCVRIHPNLGRCTLPHGHDDGTRRRDLCAYEDACPTCGGSGTRPTITAGRYEGGYDPDVILADAHDALETFRGYLSGIGNEGNREAFRSRVFEPLSRTVALLHLREHLADSDPRLTVNPHSYVQSVEAGPDCKVCGEHWAAKVHHPMEMK